MIKAPIPKFTLFQKFQLKRSKIKKWTIPTHMTPKELFVLNNLAKKLSPDGIVVEVGSYIGASSLIIAKGLKGTAKLYSVDTWKNDAMTEGNIDTFEMFNENTKSVRHKINPIRSWSVDAAKDFDQEIDMLFLDGDHSYDGVKADIDAWLPKIKSNGIIIMHDSGWAEGVKRVIAEDLKPIVKKDEELPNMYWAWLK